MGFASPPCSHLLAARLALVVAPVLLALPANAEEGVLGPKPPPLKERVPRSPRHWRDLSVDLPDEAFTAIAVDPGDPEVYFAGTDGFLFKSDDAGESWRPVLSFPRGLAIDAIDAGAEAEATLDAPEEPAAIAFDRKDERDEEDAKDDEDEEEETETLDALRIDPANVDLLFLPEPALAKRPEDMMPEGDADLTVLTFRRQGPGVRAIRFLGPTQRTVYVATPRGLFLSVDGGERFTHIELLGGALANDIRDLAVDPLRPSRLYLGTALGLLISQDGGATFQKAPGRVGHTPVLAVLATVGEDDTLVLAGTERGLFRSWDGGATFRELLLKGLSPFEPVVALGYDARTHIAYAGTAQGLFAGERKSAILERRDLFKGEVITAISVDPLRPRGVAVGVEGKGVLESEDTGLTKAAYADPLPAEDALSLARPADDPDALLVATDRGVFQHAKGTGIQVAPDRLRALERRFRKEPTLSEIGEAALRYARLESGQAAGLVERARLAALLPEVGATYRYTTGRRIQERLIVVVYSAELDEDLALLEASPTQGKQHLFFVRARWALDGLVFHPLEVQATRIWPTFHQAERRLLGRVRTLYLARRRLFAELFLAKERVSAKLHAYQMLRLAELTAQLDGATGGFFSAEAERRGASSALGADALALPGLFPRASMREPSETSE